MKTLKQYFQKARKEHWAIGQFNFSDWSQVKGVVAAAVALKSPIILGTSEGESKFVGLEEAVAVRNVLRKKYNLPVFLNLDHGKDFNYLKQAIAAGYDMVHFDGSKLPLEENIKISKKVVTAAKRKGVAVEGEVGKIGTDSSRVYEDKFDVKENELTNPDEASLYLKKTGVTVLAVSVGTLHGMSAAGISPNIRLDRVRELHNRLEIPMVLHGGSGTPENDVKEAIRLGMAKVNINTETRLAFATTLRKKLEIDKDEIVPYKYLPEAIVAVQAVAEKHIMMFGSNGKA